MSDIVEDVARVIDPGPWHKVFDKYEGREPEAPVITERKVSLLQAEAAIAAATPHIRAALFDELIAEARGKWDNQPMLWKLSLNMYVDWITEIKNRENTQP